MTIGLEEGRLKKKHGQRWPPHEKDSYEVTTEFY